MSQIQPTNQRKTVVVGHFDTHGVIAAYLAYKAFNAVEVYANYPQTSPEMLVQTIQNLYAAARERLNIVIVDVPIDLKNPMGFINGLEQLSSLHDSTLIDHHETSLRFSSQFRNVKFVYVGPAALTLNMMLLSQIQNVSDIDRLLAVVGAVGDRDPEVIRQGLFNTEIQTIADGIDVMVREKDGALKTLRALTQDPRSVIEQAKARATEIPTAQLREKMGVVCLADGLLPEAWGPKSLEKMAFQHNCWYSVGVSRDPRTNQYVTRAIIRWDVQARYSNLPMPRDVMVKLYPTRSVIGHPAAPTVAAATEEEARDMAYRITRALADETSRFASPSTLRFINEYEVGRVLTEVLLKIEQAIEKIDRVLENQARMYSEYLDLKRRQVQLLEQAAQQPQQQQQRTVRYD
jgi:hypothetical protein